MQSSTKFDTIKPAAFAVGFIVPRVTDWANANNALAEAMQNKSQVYLLHEDEYLTTFKGG